MCLQKKMTTRKYTVLLTDPTSIKQLDFTHPPTGVHGIRIRSLHYPYSLPAAGESGSLCVVLDVAGVSRSKTEIHHVITGNTNVSCSSVCTFSNAYASGNFPFVWEDDEAILLHGCRMTQLSLSLLYIPSDGTARVYIPIIAGNSITIQLDITADVW